MAARLARAESVPSPSEGRRRLTVVSHVSDRSRSVVATVVGWIVVALLAYWLLGAVIGTVRFVIRAVVWIVVLGGLVSLYARLKSRD